MTPSRSRLLTALLVAPLLAGLVLWFPGSSRAGDVRPRVWMQRETNRSRVDHDVRRVDLRAAMSDLARRHSLRMARRGELFHTWDPASYYLDGIRWTAWGENVGYTTGTIAGLERLFMRSPPHRANILNRRFDHVAIGAVRRDGRLWVTVFFYG